VNPISPFVQQSPKHPETGKRVSRLNPQEDWITFETPEMRIIEKSVWEAVKTRQANLQRLRTKQAASDPNGLSVSQGMRRRKYLLSGLLSCGQCGGNLTIAGSGKARRYYCANAKEKGAAICAGMPGLKEQEAAISILSGLKTGLMQDDAYAEFRAQFLARIKATEKDREDMLRLHDQNIRKLETRHANLMKAVEDGDFSSPIVEQLNKVDAELTEARVKRAALKPEPANLPTDLPALYRAYVEDIVTTLQDEEVSGRASEELHSLIDTVSVDWDPEAKVHHLELRGKLLKMLNAARPAEEAGLAESESSLKLVAGAGFGLWRTILLVAR